MIRDELIALIQSDPANATRTDAEVAAWANAKTITRIVDRSITISTLLSSVGAEQGAQILDKLEAAAPTIPAVKWAMKMLSTSGINTGDPETRAMLDKLVVAGVLTQADADALKSTAVEHISPTMQAGLPEIKAGHVAGVRS